MILNARGQDLWLRQMMKLQANQSLFINRQSVGRLLAVCFALTTLFVPLSFAVCGRGSQGVSEIKLSVEDQRPVAKAIEMLEAKYGWVITYEDPRYVHNSEVNDVTLKVRKDLDKFKPGEAPKVLVPKGGVLEFTYEVSPGTNLPNDPAMVVLKLLDAQAARNHGGRFRLESSGKTMHVIPTAIKNSGGVLTSQESVLDTFISLSAEDRTVERKLESICAAISQATGIPVNLGAYPSNLFHQRRDQRGAANQRARDVLVNTFESLGNGSKLSWQLFYSASLKMYLLNIHLVSK